MSIKTLSLFIVVVIVIVGGYFGYQYMQEPTQTERLINWYPYLVEVWDPPFDMVSPRSDLEYIPLENTKGEWNVCTSFPHMKDSYWLAVDYGIVDEARRLGVTLDLYQAGGYDNLETQIAQVKDCINDKVDGIIIGAISYDGLNDVVSEAHNAGIPVIDVINGMSSEEISAKSLVSFGEMGGLAGKYLVDLHVSTEKIAKVAWFPGPEGAGWVIAGDEGFREAVNVGNIEIVATRYGDTGKQKQSELINEVLDLGIEVDYIVGTAVTAEAAVDVLKERELEDEIEIISYYFTPPVYEGILKREILAASTDSSVIQGRIAVDQIVRILEGKNYSKHVGPKLYIVDSSNVYTFDKSTSLAPTDFEAVFNVD